MSGAPPPVERPPGENTLKIRTQAREAVAPTLRRHRLMLTLIAAVTALAWAITDYLHRLTSADDARRMEVLEAEVRMLLELRPARPAPPTAPPTGKDGGS